MDKKMLIRLLRRPVRLDRQVEAPEPGAVFDLDLLQRSFEVSLLVARLQQRPANYLRGKSGAAEKA
jgi:hypothetical protein